METKNNSGAIFKNTNKKAETHPDYKGKVNVNNKEMEIALWVKQSKDGKTYFSASFSEPYVKQEAQNIIKPVQNYNSGNILDGVNDDLPF